MWQLAAREAIRETVAAYSFAADTGRFDELAQLFTSDGVLEIRDGETSSGRDAIRSFLGVASRNLEAASTTRMIRHFVSNLRISLESPAHATGACYFLAITEIGVDHWGRYRDTYVPDGDAWLFAHRFVRVDGHASGGQLQNTLRSP